jgi:DNA-directed RNA polymerase III subunit RPC1
MTLVDHELATPRFRNECTPAYLETVRNFIFSNVARKLADSRRCRGMFDALEKADEWDEGTDLSLGASGEQLGQRKRSIMNLVFVAADKALIDNTSKVTECQLRSFLDLCWVKYVKARIEPGNL